MELSHLEYLIFSGLAYCYFDDRDIGKSISDIFYYDKNCEENKKRILIKHDLFKTFNYYATWEVVGEAMVPFLKDWYVIDILDRTDFGNEENKTGYYSIAFGKKEKEVYETILIAYRGSQLFPFKEAYRDFIETDLKIGLGKKPVQFDEGLEFYERIINKYDYKKVQLTGHSLGGGIAQYAAVMSQVYFDDLDFVPKTVTFNSVGISVDGMIRVEDFLELKKAREYVCTMVEDSKWEGIKNSLIFYLKTKASFIKSSTKVTLIPQNFNSQYLKVRDIEKKALMSQLKLVKGFNLDEENFNILMDLLFDREALEEELQMASRILNNFNQNKIYKDRVINFAHSNDFTATYFPHVGKVVYVDKYLAENGKDTGKEFLKTLGIFKKIIKEYHLFDVFIPFIGRKNGMNILYKENDFTNKINIRYISSSLRRLIYKEKCSKELLIYYYKKNELLSDKDLKKIKKQVVEDFDKNKKLYVYGEHVVEKLKIMEDKEFKYMWFDALDKLPSPYEYQDIFDYVNFVFEENIL